MSESTTDGVDAVVTHHTNPFRSGVARFNQILAERLGVPLVALRDGDLGSCHRPLLSFKVSELPPDLVGSVERRLDAGPPWGCFLHEYADLPLEHRIAEGAAPLLAGNEAIASALRENGLAPEVAWAPGMVFDTREFAPAELSIFSFGMANKLQVGQYVHLRDLLEADGRSYALYFSNATHETARGDEQEAVYAAMKELFPRNLYFLGELSDVAVFNWLRDTTFFAAFFRDGARGNNTSIASAMEHGAVVITNLDEHSPPSLEHLDNVIDLNRADDLPRDPLTLRRISVRAMETARARDWSALIEVVRGAGAQATSTSGSLRSATSASSSGR